MHELWHWIVTGFAIGLGGAFGFALGNGLMSLFRPGGTPR